MFATAGQIAIDRPARSASLLQTVTVWIERSAQRRALASLTVEALKDIGIDPADAVQEAAKPFWAA